MRKIAARSEKGMFSQSDLAARADSIASLVSSGEEVEKVARVEACLWGIGWLDWGPEAGTCEAKACQLPRFRGAGEILNRCTDLLAVHESRDVVRSSSLHGLELSDEGSALGRVGLVVKVGLIGDLGELVAGVGRGGHF